MSEEWGQPVAGEEAGSGQYSVIAKLGQGGMAGVFLAVARGAVTDFHKLVVLKRLHDRLREDAGFVRMFVREAQIAARLNHPNVVHTYSVDLDEGQPVLVMEYLDGVPLSALRKALRGRPFEERWLLLAVIAQSLAGLHYVHDLADYDGTPMGLVHRDIKPANVFALRERDGSWRCKLLDFGLCTGGQGEHLPLTVAGVQLGTPGYAAPEQLRGEPVDGRADLYGLACVMVELLTGRPAFEGTDGQARIANQLAGRRAYALDRAGLHPDVVTLLERGLSLDPQLRHDDPEAFARAVAQVARAPEPSPPPRSALWVAGFVGLALTSAAAVALWPASPPSTLDASLTANVVIPEAPTPQPAAVVPEPPPTATPEPPVEAPVAKRPKRRRRTAKPSAPEPAAPAPVRSYPKGIRDPFAVD